MAIKFRCPHCSQLLGISTTKAGSIVDCPACGRSVNVPVEGGAGRNAEPKLPSIRDSGLLNALQELSALGGQTRSELTAPPVLKALPSDRKSPVSRTSSTQPDASPNRDRDTMRIVPLTSIHSNTERGPATEQTDVLSELAEMAHPESAEPLILDESLGTNVIDPKRKVDAFALPSSASHDPGALSVALQELAGVSNAAHTPAMHSQQPIHESTSKQSAFLPLMFALPAFAIGLLLGTFWKSHGTQNPAESTAKVGDTIPAATIPAPEVGERQINGIVTYVDDSGNSIADSSATVLVLSTENTTRLRLDARPLREASDSKARQAIESALKTLGGSVFQTDSSGQWTAITPANTAVNVIVISRHRSRTESQPVPTDVLESLSSWFDSPMHIVGRLAAKQSVVPPASDTESNATLVKIEFARGQ